MTKTERERILNLIEKTIDIYGEMLQKITIERDKEFNSVPFEKSINALNQLLEMKETDD